MTRYCKHCNCPEENHHPISRHCPLPYGGFPDLLVHSPLDYGDRLNTFEEAVCALCGTKKSEHRKRHRFTTVQPASATEQGS